MGDSDNIRINKYLAMCGVCSRRDADRLVEEKRVTINGALAVSGSKVSSGDEVRLNGKLIGGQEKKVVLAYYKPVGITCTEKDRHAEKTIKDVLPYPVRLTYAGRLDKDSEGLLIMTNDGDLIDAMMRASNHHEKEYEVKVNKELTKTFLDAMASGVYLKDLELTTRECKIEATGKYTFRIILTQGVNRQIRRMCKSLGFTVQKIKRTRVMNIKLAGLVPGKYREVTGEELAKLYKDCKLI